MSLEPTWFSTIFGVVIFATGVVSSYAVLILTTLALRSAGPLKGAVTVEHYHDLGKLMFGFLVFWAYVSFAQLMLIWYAAQPEEVTFFHNRWDYAPWQNDVATRSSSSASSCRSSGRSRATSSATWAASRSAQRSSS